MAPTIGYLFARHNSTYGSPRITADLRALGWRVSKNTVAALMAEQGLVGLAAKAPARWHPAR